MSRPQYSIESIIKQLRETRRKLRLSQLELGLAINMPQSYISSIEQGRKDIRLNTLIQIARVLELEVMLIPREMVGTVESLFQETSSDDTPAYAIEDDYD